MAKRRVHLTFPGKLADEPLLWQLSQKFEIIFNIRQADYTEGFGWMMTELEGSTANLEAALRWVEGQGVLVAPIEQDVVH